MMMKIRYNYIKNIVNELFVKFKICSYPIDISSIFSKSKNCKVVSYSDYLKKYDLFEEEVIEYFGSDEGCTIYSPKKNRYLVVYNDLNIHYKTPSRRRWTITHELGHIVLNHLRMTNKVKIFRNNLSNAEYDWLEAEANRFASLFLANPVILHELHINNNNDIAEICRLSDEASKYRFDDYLKWSKYKYMNSSDKFILKQFHDFIYKKQCLRCGHAFISETAKYCPICGYNKLTRGDGAMIYNDGIPLRDNGKAIFCPVCGNEETDLKGDYCQICGTYIVNRCCNTEGYQNSSGEWIEPCGKIVGENARYCSDCGSITTFHTSLFLKDWRVAKEEIEYKLNPVEPILDDDIPF